MALVRNDLRREWRGREVIGLMLPFALATGLALNFTFDLAVEERVLVAMGALWTALLFATILGLSRAFALEQENGVWEGLTLAPVEPGALYVAKLLSNLALLIALDAVVVPVFAVLYNLPLLDIAPLASVELGTLAFGAAGTLFVPLAGQTRAREILLPVLLPLLVPVIIGAAAALLILTGIVLAFFFAPTERVQGHAQRISYFHLPLAWVAYLAFFLVLVGSIGYLWKRRAVWDRLAQASAEIGLVSTSLVLVTGALWGKIVWGTWWSWDPRLTTRWCCGSSTSATR